MTLSELLNVMRRLWFIVLAGIAIGAVAATVTSLVQPTRYTATSAIYISAASASDVTDLSQGASFTQQIVKSYAALATSQFVLEPALSKLGISESPSDAAKDISAIAEADTSIIDIQVTNASPLTAARLADNIATQLASAAADLTPTSSPAASAVKVTRVNAAEVPTAPTSPRVGLNVAVGLLAGALLGIGAAIVLNNVDTRIRRTSDLPRALAIPLLAEIPVQPKPKRKNSTIESPVVVTDIEAYKTLRANLQFTQVDNEASSIVITSSLAGDGKSTTAVNLAAAFAEAGRTTLLVDADLRRPSIAKYLGIDGAVGITDVLARSTTVDSATQIWGNHGLRVLPAGTVPPNPSELLQSDSMKALMEALSDDFEVVVFDSPPTLLFADAAILARHTSGVIMIAAAQKTRSHQLSRAIESIHKVPSPVIGLVMTMVQVKSSLGYSYARYGYRDYASEA